MPNIYVICQLNGKHKNDCVSVESLTTQQFNVYNNADLKSPYMFVFI